MPGLRRRWLRVAGVFVALSASTACGAPGQGKPGALSAAPAPPGRAVALEDGRNLNLRCSGHGSPTVLLESGWGADSTAWSRVQPTLSRDSRVCAYDRAGNGLSDPGPLPRDGAAVVRDLDQALRRAQEDGPFVVVGHSAGGLYARLFAARRPRDVLGLVLLDPTVEHFAPPEFDGLGGMRRRAERCASASEATPQPPADDAQWQGCLPPPGPALAMAQKPGTWRNRLSELNSLFDQTSRDVMRATPALRSVPIYVITASQTAASSGEAIRGGLSNLELQHQAIAGASIAGSQRTVLSSHLVMVDRPDAVVEAVVLMVDAARNGRPPPQLPPSEELMVPKGGELEDLARQLQLPQFSLPPN